MSSLPQAEAVAALELANPARNKMACGPYVGEGWSFRGGPKVPGEGAVFGMSGKGLKDPF